MTHTQELWGRKFQASLAYTYFSSGHQGVDVGCGVWDWTPLEWLSILPKIGYGAKVLEQNFDGNKAYHLSWGPTMGLDLTFSINSFVKIFASYTWAMYKDFSDEVNQLHGGSVGLRIAY